MSRLTDLIQTAPREQISNIMKVSKSVCEKSYHSAAVLLQGMAMQGTSKWFDDCNNLAIIYFENWLLSREVK